MLRLHSSFGFAGWAPWTRWLGLAAVGVSLPVCLALVGSLTQWSAPADAWIVAVTIAGCVVAFLQSTPDARVPGGGRAAWRIVGIGLACQSLAAVAWGLLPFVRDQELFVGWFNASRLVAVPLIAAGLIASRPNLHRTSRRVTLAIDTAVWMSFGALLAWYLVRQTMPADVAARWFRTSPVLWMLPGVHILTLVATSALYIRLVGFEARASIALIGAGLAAQFALSMLAIVHLASSPTLLTVLQVASAVLILLGMLGGYNVRRAGGPYLQRPALSALRSTLIPFVPVVIGAAMLLDLQVRSGDFEIALIHVGLFAAALIVIARQVVALREHARLSDKQARADIEMRFQTIVQFSSDLIMIVQGADTVRYVSPAIASVFNHDATAIVGTPLRELVHADDVVSMLGFLAEAAKPTSLATTSHWRMRNANDVWCRTETVAVNLFDDPTVAGLVLTTRDITRRVALEEQLVHRAFHDELTGLANRALFTNRVEQALLRASRDAQRTAVLFLDLDDFKEINDSLGHAAGDSLLMQGADRLRACLRAGDTACRLGGDEFAVLLEGCQNNGEEAMHVAERISNAFARPFDLEDREAFCTASIGVVISNGSEAGDDLLRHADLAMYLAKKRGKARVERFASHMHEEVVERLDLLADLRYAIERDELQLEYQPIVDLDTRQVSGLETLVRWDHPKRGRIPPADFIPIAEQSGLIVSIGRWVLLHACAHARHWSRSLPELLPVTVTVNLSARQLGDVNLIDDVANALRVAGLRRDQLVLELTESTLLANSEETVGILTSLKALGVRLAIDDFGTGYSSLSYLHRFPVDVLKIDKSFVAGVAGGPGASALASAVIALGNSLGLRTVAEGIENEAQFMVLSQLGCKLGQGFLFSHPLPPGDVMPYLARHGQRKVDAPRTGHLTPMSNDVIG